MPLNKDFALRIEIIDECLRNRLRKWTLEKLVEEVNRKLDDRYNKSATKRTVQNDLKFLIEVKGAPISKSREGNTTFFSYSDSNYSIKNIPLSMEDIELLYDAIKILKQVNEFSILRDVDEIVRRLHCTIVSNEERNSPSFVQFERHTVALGTNYIDDIISAIKNKVVLKISYQPFKAEEPKGLLFCTYVLKEFRNRWFAIGQEVGKAKICILALDRIKHLKPTADDFVDNRLFDPDTYFNNLIGVSIPENSTIQEIQIKVCASQAPYVLTKPIHHTQRVLNRNVSGEVIVAVQVIDNYEFRSVILSYGADVEILKPLEIREAMQLVFKKGAANYI